MNRRPIRVDIITKENVTTCADSTLALAPGRLLPICCAGIRWRLIVTATGCNLCANQDILHAWFWNPLKADGRASCLCVSLAFGGKGFDIVAHLVHQAHEISCPYPSLRSEQKYQTTSEASRKGGALKADLGHQLRSRDPLVPERLLSSVKG
jgi:hypothetical protein